MEAAGRVGDDEVGVAGHRGVEGVEDDRARVSAWRVGDDIDPGPVGPDAKLVDRRRAERVGGGEDDAPTLALVARGEFADGRRLAGPVDADDEDDRGTALDGPGGLPAGRIAWCEEVGELGADGPLGSTGIAPLASSGDEVDRQRRADVAGDERLLDVLPGLLPPARERCAKPGGEARPGALETGLQRGLLALTACRVGLLG